MRVVLFLAALLFTLVASFPFSNSARAGNADLGERLFNQNCIGCHAGGKNVVSFEQDLSKNALDQYLGDSRSPELIKRQIKFGNGGVMPTFDGKLSDADIDDIAEYIITKADQGW